MADLVSITDLQLNENEYCYTVASGHYTDNSFKIRITKYMSLLSGNADICRNYFNKNIFINDKDCIPTPNNFVKCQNYLTVNRAPTCTLYGKIDSNGILPANTAIKCVCMNNNIKDLYITDIV